MQALSAVRLFLPQQGEFHAPLVDTDEDQRRPQPAAVEVNPTAAKTEQTAEAGQQAGRVITDLLFVLHAGLDEQHIGAYRAGVEKHLVVDAAGCGRPGPATEGQFQGLLRIIRDAQLPGEMIQCSAGQDSQFRGFARQVGCCQAQGTVTAAYQDSVFSIGDLPGNGWRQFRRGKPVQIDAGLFFQDRDEAFRPARSQVQKNRQGVFGVA